MVLASSKTSKLQADIPLERLEDLCRGKSMAGRSKLRRGLAQHSEVSINTISKSYLAIDPSPSLHTMQD